MMVALSISNVKFVNRLLTGALRTGVHALSPVKKLVIAEDHSRSIFSFRSTQKRKSVLSAVNLPKASTCNINHKQKSPVKICGVKRSSSTTFFQRNEFKILKKAN